MKLRIIVVIPDVMDNIDKPTFKLLMKFINNGGQVIQFGEGAKFVDAEPSDELIKLTSSKNWIKQAVVIIDAIKEFLLENDFTVNDG